MAAVRGRRPYHRGATVRPRWCHRALARRCQTEQRNADVLAEALKAPLGVNCMPNNRGSERGDRQGRKPCPQPARIPPAMKRSMPPKPPVTRTRCDPEAALAVAERRRRPERRHQGRSAKLSPGVHLGRQCVMGCRLFRSKPPAPLGRLPHLGVMADRPRRPRRPSRRGCRTSRAVIA